MKYDAEKYRHRKSDVAAILLRNPDRPILDMVGVISVSTEIPIIVVASFVGELTGFTDELLLKIERLREFYEQ